jgi:5-methylcytosine-specific restriction protein A
MGYASIRALCLILRCARMSEEARGWEWGRIRKAKLDDNVRHNAGVCEAQLSGCLGFAEEVHHVVARVIGGGHNDQLLALCSACHYRYTTELNQMLAAERRVAKRNKKRKNHPGRKDRHE